jgi:hypothetical protein
VANDILEDVKDDIKFLLKLAPAYNPDDVEPGLAKMFYATDSYEGDVALVSRIKDIMDRYDIQEVAPEDEDFAEID